MNPAGQSQSGGHSPPPPGKESYGPAGRDYFWILCRLVDSLPSPPAGAATSNPSPSLNAPSGINGVNLEGLARQLANGIAERKIYEKRRFSSEGRAYYFFHT